MAYVTRVELRNYIGLTGSQYDSTLDTLADAASAACDVFTGRTKGTNGYGFLTHSNTSEIYFLDNKKHIVLEEWPVVSVSAMTLRGTAQIVDTDYYLKYDSGIVTFFDASGYPYKESGPLVVTYIAGFEELPADVELTCLRVAAYWFARKSTEGVGAQLLSDIQETFRIPEVKRILEEGLSGYTLNAVGIGSL
jgi:hypothetical protein